MAINVAEIIKLANELLDIKKEITNEIKKDSDKKKRKKLNKAVNKLLKDPSPETLVAFRNFLYKH